MALTTAIERPARPPAGGRRVYDAAHLKQHPLQKVGAMKLLLTAEQVPEDEALNYSFRLGVSFRHRPGDFDSSGDCGHIKASESEQGKTQLGCSVDCDGGGITVELARDDKSTLVRLDSIRIWRNKAVRVGWAKAHDPVATP